MCGIHSLSAAIIVNCLQTLNHNYDMQILTNVHTIYYVHIHMGIRVFVCVCVCDKHRFMLINSLMCNIIQLFQLINFHLKCDDEIDCDGEIEKLSRRKKNIFIYR